MCLVGVPYVDICVSALKLDPAVTGQIRDRFMGTVGRGYLFVFEEEKGDEGGEGEGWTHVTPLPSFLSSLGRQLSAHEQQQQEGEGVGGVQGVLDRFLGAMQAAVAQGKYDTRTRVVSEGGSNGGSWAVLCTVLCTAQCSAVL